MRLVARGLGNHQGPIVRRLQERPWYCPEHVGDDFSARQGEASEVAPNTNNIAAELNAWVACDKCNKWRKVTPEVSAYYENRHWNCKLHQKQDGTSLSCQDPCEECGKVECCCEKRENYAGYTSSGTSLPVGFEFQRRQRQNGGGSWIQLTGHCEKHSLTKNFDRRAMLESWFNEHRHCRPEWYGLTADAVWDLLTAHRQSARKNGGSSGGGTSNGNSDSRLGKKRCRSSSTQDESGERPPPLKIVLKLPKAAADRVRQQPQFRTCDDGGTSVPMTGPSDVLNSYLDSLPATFTALRESLRAPNTSESNDHAAVQGTPNGSVGQGPLQPVSRLPDAAAPIAADTSGQRTGAATNIAQPVPGGTADRRTDLEDQKTNLHSVQHNAPAESPRASGAATPQQSTSVDQQPDGNITYPRERYVTKIEMMLINWTRLDTSFEERVRQLVLSYAARKD